MTSDRIAFAGAGRTPFGRLDGYDAMELHAWAAAEALNDAGLEIAEIDGLVCCGAVTEPFPAYAVPLAERVGLHPKWCLTVQSGGASHTAAVTAAGHAIASGRAETVLVVFADATLSRVGRDGMVSLSPTMTRRAEEAGYGLHIPAQYALIASRWHYEHSREPGCLAPIAVAARQGAVRHPLAFKRTPLTVAEVQESRMISTPLRKLESSVVCDGGAALIIRRSSGKSGEIELLGAGEETAWWNVSQAEPLTDDAAGRSMRKAMDEAGIRAADLDFACLYDSFTISVAMQLEGLGLCAPGEAPSFVDEVGISPDGGFPVNPHGGLLSFGHAGYPACLNQVVEAVLQLRGTSPGAQLRDVEMALVHGVLGPMSYHSTMVIGRR